MELLKGLNLLIAAIIIISNSSSIGNNNTTKGIKVEDEFLIFKSENKKVIFSKNEYELTIDSNRIDVYFLDTIKVLKIKELIKPVIKFYIKGKKIIAKGNPIDRSTVPEECNYFYATDDKGNIVFFKKNIIYLNRIN
jgi:hypothetical protein